MADREVWRPIPGRNGYEASNLGRLRSVGRWIYYDVRRRWVRDRILRTRITKFGYEQVVFNEGTALVHALVMLAFYGLPPEGMEVCHADNNKQNNSLTNLRYGTRKSNEADKDIHGTRLWGESHHQVRLSSEDVLSIRVSDKPRRELAEMYGVCLRHIFAIRAKKSWRRLVS